LAGVGDGGESHQMFKLNAMAQEQRSEDLKARAWQRKGV
jgi:hypothetical protein